MFRTDNVEGGRVKAHEATESVTEKAHELIDKVAGQAVAGGEKAQELSDALRSLGA